MFSNGVVFRKECHIINIINQSDRRKILTKSVIAIKRVTCEKEKANERNEIDEYKRIIICSNKQYRSYNSMNMTKRHSITYKFKISAIMIGIPLNEKMICIYFYYCAISNQYIIHPLQKIFLFVGA